MALNPPSGIVKWYSTPLGERGWNSFRAQLTGKDYPGTSRKTSYVKLSEKEADEVIENIKKDPEGIPLFDEANAPDKAEEYQKWLVARYSTGAKEEGFESRKQEGTKQLEEELGPEGLDELLNLIKEESKVEVGATVGGGGGGPTSSESPPPPPPSLALAIVPKKPDDLVEEEIDSQILSILGLEDVFDLTYEEYATLLKEKAVEARMSSSQMTTESAELITNEYKRVKGKTGSFKVKKKKINIEKVLDRKPSGPKKTTIDPKKLLPPSEIGEEKTTKEVIEFKEAIIDELDTIGDKLDELLNQIKKEDKEEKKVEEKERIKGRKEKKKKREEKLESKSKSKIENAFTKVTKPFVSFFDRIKQFFMMILLGSAVKFLLKVINDPSIILNPIKNFVNGIINFLNNIINWLWKFVTSPINFIIDQINTGIQGAIDAINNVTRFIGQDPIKFKPIDNLPDDSPIQIPTIPVQQQEEGGTVINVKELSYAEGGNITNNSGLTITGLGKDTQLIAAQPGEVMISKPAVDMFGASNLLAMNSMAGSTNKPKFGALNGIQAMQDGGQVGLDKKYGISRVRNSIAKVKSGNAPKGIIVVPGHTYGGGTPGATNKLGEFKANKIMSQFIVNQVRQKDPSIPIQYLEKMFPDSDDGLKQAIDYYKGLESQGYEVLEIHHDAYGPHGMGAGLLGSYTNFSKLDSSLARRGGSFGANYKGRFKEGYGMNRGGISMFELAKLEGQYEQGLLKGDVGAKQAAGNPVIQAILETYGGRKTQPPGPPSASKLNVVPVQVPAGGGQQAPTSGSSGQQATVPAFSSEDPNNMTTLVVKSIYNLIG